MISFFGFICFRACGFAKNIGWIRVVFHVPWRILWRAIACRENCHFHSTGTRSTVNASRRVTSCRQWQPLTHCGALPVALSRSSTTLMKELLPLLSFPRFSECAYARPRLWITPSLPPCHDLIMAAGAAASRRGVHPLGHGPFAAFFHATIVAIRPPALQTKDLARSLPSC